MALSVFDDRAAAPSEGELAHVLGPALASWHVVRAAASSTGRQLSEEWGYTSPTTGWSLRLKDGPRVIAYLTSFGSMPTRFG